MASHEEPALSSEEQAHFDRIASAFQAYAHMNLKRIRKAERDYRRFQASLDGNLPVGRRPRGELPSSRPAGFLAASCCRAAARV